MMFTKEQKKAIRGVYNVFFNNKVSYSVEAGNRRVTLFKGDNQFGTKHALKRHFYSSEDRNILSYEDIALFAMHLQDSSFVRKVDKKSVFEQKRFVSTLTTVLSKANSLITYYSNRKFRPLDNKRNLNPEKLRITSIQQLRAKIRTIAKSSSHYDEFDLRISMLGKYNNITKKEILVNAILHKYESQSLQDFFNKINENNTFFNSSCNDVDALEIASRYTELYFEEHPKSSNVDCKIRLLKESKVHPQNDREKDIYKELQAIGLIKEVEKNIYSLDEKYQRFFLEYIAEDAKSIQEEFAKCFTSKEEKLSDIEEQQQKDGVNAACMA